MQINNQLNPSPLFNPNLINGHTIFGNTKNIPSSLPSSANALTISTGIEFENESLLQNHDESNENQDPNLKTTASENNTIFLEDYITHEPVDFNKLCLSTDQLEDPDSSSSLSRGSKKIAKLSPQQDSQRKISKTSPKTDERNKGKKHPWQPAEDAKVLELVNQYGQSWAIIASSLGNRTGKQVRDRYLNYLRPDINEEDFTHQEDQLLLSLYYQLGHRWSKIASFMPGRTECQVKNRYYTVIKKKLVSPESHEKKISYNQNHNETLYKYGKMNFEINEEDIFRGAEEENTITRESSAGLAAGQMPWSDPTDVISYETSLFNQSTVQNYPVINFTENHFQQTSFIAGGQKANLNGILFDEFGHHDENAHKKALSKLETELHNREKLQRYEELLRRKQALEFFYRKTLQEMNNLEDKEFPGHNKMI